MASFKAYQAIRAKTYDAIFDEEETSKVILQQFVERRRVAAWAFAQCARQV